jgi:hypothetical protein
MTFARKSAEDEGEKMATVRARPQIAYRKWRDDDEARSSVAASDTLFKYQLVWADGRDAGRAAYHAEIRPGDIIANYQGQWVRVLARTPIDREDSPYDGLLRVERA